jgi:hypothetical protein
VHVGIAFELRQEIPGRIRCPPPPSGADRLRPGTDPWVWAWWQAPKSPTLVAPAMRPFDVLSNAWEMITKEKVVGSR